jgi:hypothetical protein
MSVLEAYCVVCPRKLDTMHSMLCYHCIKAIEQGDKFTFEEAKREGVNMSEFIKDKRRKVKATKKYKREI